MRSNYENSDTQRRKDNHSPQESSLWKNVPITAYKLTTTDRQSRSIYVKETLLRKPMGMYVIS